MYNTPILKSKRVIIISSAIRNIIHVRISVLKKQPLSPEMEYISVITSVILLQLIKKMRQKVNNSINMTQPSQEKRERRVSRLVVINVFMSDYSAKLHRSAQVVRTTSLRFPPLKVTSIYAVKLVLEKLPNNVLVFYRISVKSG